MASHLSHPYPHAGECRTTRSLTPTRSLVLVMFYSILLMGLGVVALPTTSLARAWPTTDGWTIVESDEACGMKMVYEGKGATSLLIGQSVDGQAFINVTNAAWTAVADKQYKNFKWVFDGTVYESGVGGTHLAGGNPGFTAYFDADLLTIIAQSGKLVIFHNSQTVDSLSLAGSKAAVRIVHQCITSLRLRHEASEVEKHRFDSIVDDPFSTEGASPKPINLEGFVARMFGLDSYPASALREGAQGIVTFRAKIGVDGRVDECAIVSSSGNRDLDDATCRILERSGRLPAALVPSTREITTSVKWQLPAS